MAIVNLPDNSAEATVVNKFDQVTVFANEAFEIAMQAIEDIGSSSYFSAFSVDTSIEDPLVDFTSGAVVPISPVIDIVNPATVPTLTLNDVDTVSPIEIPEFTGVAPTIDTIEKPVIIEPEDPGNVPVLGEIDIPVTPDITTHIMQETPDIILPTAPEVPAARDFEDDLIVVDLVEPGYNFIYDEVPYTSDLGDGAYNWLLDQINAGGGTGLGADIEAAILQRGQDRRQVTDERTYDEAENYHASRGWGIPTGALRGALAEALREQTRSDEQLNYEILIEMGRLAQTNTHFIISSSLEDERQLMDHFNKVADRAFKAASYVAEYAISLSNSRIAVYNIRTEAQRTAALVFSAKVQADLFELEKFKTLMEGAKLEADVKESLARVYSAKIEAERLKVQIYAIQAESAKILSDMQKLDIDKYRVIVEAYVAKVNANTSRYNQYQAEIAGETLKVEIYKTEAEAYEARVRGLSVSSDVEVKNIVAQIEYNNGLITEFKARSDFYISEAELALNDADTKARIYGYDVEAYRAIVTAEAEVANVKVRGNAVKVDARAKEIEGRIETIRLDLENGRSNYQFDMKKLETVADISAQIASSSISSVNASAQIGFSTGANASGDVTRDVITTNHSLSGSL